MEKIKLGSIYSAGTLMGSGFIWQDDTPFEIGDTMQGVELQWVPFRNLLIADRVVCNNISWKQLNKLGYIFGVPTKIDGRFYLCRSLKVGIGPENPGEWDDALTAVGDDDEIWNWAYSFFWGQETPPAHKTCRMERGYSDAYNFGFGEATGRSEEGGFRPVLELLPPMPSLTDALIGQQVEIYGQGKEFIFGRVAGFDDYDLVLENPTKIPPRCSWAVRRGKTAVIKRNSITWIGNIEP